MSVNNMTKEQAYTLINAIHQQATGQTGLVATDYTSFISVANSTLAAGYDPVLNAITQVVQRTIVAVRPYYEKFKGLEMSADTWGGILRKINFADRGAEAEESYNLVDGQAIDQYVVRKPNVLETRYVGSNVYSAHYTITREQLKTAFTNETEFSSFMSGLIQHFANERTQWFENLKRSILANAIAAKSDMNADVINLRTLYNGETGQSLTLNDLMKADNYDAFMKWAYAKVAGISRMMTERSQKYQMVITGKPIMRHTPYRDQRVYMIADFLEGLSARVLADTYHDNFLKYADVEAVSFWQAIDAPEQINATPVYINASGVVTNGTAQTLDNIVGIIFDRDAMGYNIFNDSLDTSPFNARGQYYNLYAHADVQLQTDFTEKMVVFTLN